MGVQRAGTTSTSTAWVGAGSLAIALACTGTTEPPNAPSGSEASPADAAPFTEVPPSESVEPAPEDTPPGHPQCADAALVKAAFVTYIEEHRSCPSMTKLADLGLLPPERVEELDATFVVSCDGRMMASTGPDGKFGGGDDVQYGPENCPDWESKWRSLVPQAQ